MTTFITVKPVFEVNIPRVLTREEVSRIVELSGVTRIMMGQTDTLVLFQDSAYTEEGIDLMIRATLDDGEVEWI